MIKGSINAFDHMELCLVINLTKGGNWAISRPPIFDNMLLVSGLLVLRLTFIPGSKYLPAKKVNF